MFPSGDHNGSYFAHASTRLVFYWRKLTDLPGAERSGEIANAAVKGVIVLSQANIYRLDPCDDKFFLRAL